MLQSMAVRAKGLQVCRIVVRVIVIAVVNVQLAGILWHEIAPFAAIL